MPNATLDKESQLQRVLEGINKLYEHPAARAYEQLSGIFTDPATAALPMMGFRLPGPEGVAAAAKAARVLDDVAAGREAMGQSAERPLFGQMVPRMPHQNQAVLDGGRATSPSVDTMYAGVGDDLAAELSNIRLAKQVAAAGGMEKLERQATLQALLELRRSLGSAFTGKPHYKQ